MKTILLLLCLAFAVPSFTGCTTPPSQRVQTVQTLKIVGLTIDAAMKTAAALYHQDKITAAQWDKISSFHTTKFRPVFKIAVDAVQENMESLASPEVSSLAQQLLALIPSS